MHERMIHKIQIFHEKKIASKIFNQIVGHDVFNVN